MSSIDRQTLLAWYRRNRERSRALFELIDETAYYSRPIALRNPVVFYEGHLPAFTANAFLKRALKQSGIDEELETLFARGIDPENEAEVARGSQWPSRDVIDRFSAEIDRRVEQAILSSDIDVPDDPLLHDAWALRTVLEHESMHQETLLYIFHQLPYSQKRRPTGVDERRSPSPRTVSGEMITIYPGVATLGLAADGMFGWDNEFPLHEVDVEEFEIDEYPVTNEEFLEFVDSGGYEEERYWREHWQWLQQSRITHPHFWEKREDGWLWRGMFDSFPLPMDGPVYVTFAEASAYARWKWKRLPSEAEFHRAAYGTPDGLERSQPWGEDFTEQHGNFDSQRFDPLPVGSHPKGQSAWGVHELVGNGWEWTSSVFGPFDGFQPMATYPEYSVDFFDGKHYVLKGASPATPRELIRRSFRNWFRPTYPYMYAKFRCVSD